MTSTTDKSSVGLGRTSPVIAWCLGAIALIAAVSVATYWPTLNHAFLNWDDDRNFLANPHYRGVSTEQWTWAWQTYHVGVWQPLAWMLLGAEHALAGVDDMGSPRPRVYHAFSIGLHAANAVMLFVVALLLVRQALPRVWHSAPGGIIFGALAAALLYAVHPLRVEAAAWISCQPYLPAGLFFLAGLALHVWLHSGARSRGVRVAGWLGTLACYAMAVGFKAAAISLPTVLLIADVYPLRRLGGSAGWLGRGPRRAVLEKLPFVALAAVVAVQASAAKDFNQSRLPMDAVDYGRATAQAAWGLVFYLWKTVAPAGLIPFVRLPDDLGLTTPRFAAAALGVALVSLGTIAFARRIPALAACWWAYVIILVPNLGLVQISQQLVTDRYSYIASTPLMVLLAGGIARYWTWREGSAGRVRIALLCGVAVAILVRLTIPQAMIWHDSISLWQANVARDPDGAVGHCQLGHAYASAAKLDKARRHLARATELRGDFAFAHSNLGTVLIFQGEFDAAIVALKRALAAPESLPAAEMGKVHANLALAYAASGNRPLAQQHLTTAQRLGCPPELVLRVMDMIIEE